MQFLLDFCFYKKPIPLFTHSADEKEWADKLKGHIFFSHGKTNLYGVATGYIESNKFEVLDKNKIDKNGLMLILDVKVYETNFVLVNIFNPNTETEEAVTSL